MNDWDKILANYAETGTFYGKGRKAEDAYFAFFGREPAYRRVLRLGLQALRTDAAGFSSSDWIRWFSALPRRRRS